MSLAAPAARRRLVDRLSPAIAQALDVSLDELVEVCP
jgi:hypothetical protein